MLDYPFIQVNKKWMVVKDTAHTSIFSGQTGCGKTHLILNLLESAVQTPFLVYCDHLPNITVEQDLPD